MKKEPVNKTTDFLVPLLGKSKSYYSPYLEDAYLGDSEEGIVLYNTILMVFRNSGQLRFLDIVEFLRNHEGYVGEFELLERAYVVFIIQLPEKFHEDYSKFLKGKYSEFSPEAKTLLCMGRKTGSSMHRVLSKDPSLRLHFERSLSVPGSVPVSIPQECELWSIVDPEKEMLNRDDLKKQLPNKQIHTASEF